METKREADRTNGKETKRGLRALQREEKEESKGGRKRLKVVRAK